MSEPLLHGWITVEYAIQLFDELCEFLAKHKKITYIVGSDAYLDERADLPMGKKCQSMTISAANVEKKKTSGPA